MPILAAVARVLDPDPPADADLLARFAAGRDEAAFAELLRRHGPMVLGICRRVLADPHAADDAFQAVFVVLARRAGTIRPPGQVGPWLYGVAVKTATKAKVMAAKRRTRELAGGRRDVAAESTADWSDVRPVIDAELARLPDQLRAAVVLCDLGGKSRSEAARELGCPEGTLATRLARAREVLAARLTRRGVTLSAAGVAGLLAAGSAVAVPAALASAALAAVGGPGSAVPPSVQTLADGVVRSMSATYWKLGIAAAVLAGGLLAGGAAVSGGSADPPDTAAARIPAKPPPAAPPEAERQQDLWVWQERPAPAVAGGAVGPVLSVAFAPDGKTFLTAGDGRFRQWDAATLTPYTVGGNRTGPAPADGVAISPDGKAAALATKDGVQGVAYPAEPGTEPQPDGRVVDVSAKTIWLMDRKRDQLSGPAVAFSPDGKWLAASDGFTTGFRLIRGGRPVTSNGAKELAGQAGNLPAAVAWSPDGRTLAYIHPTPPDADGMVGMIGVTPEIKPPNLAGHKGKVVAVAWAKDGKRLATGGSDGQVILWDGETFKEVRRLKLSGPVTALAFRADGKRIAAGVVSNPAGPGEKSAAKIEVWTDWGESTPDNWQRSSTLGVPAAERVRALAFAPDGRTLVAGTEAADGKGGGLRVWNRMKLAPAPAAGWREKPAAPNLLDHGGPVVSVAFARDGKSIYTSGSITHPADPPQKEWATTGGGYKWELPTFRRRLTFRTNQPGPAAAAVSSDESKVALATADQVWLAALGPYQELAVWKDLGGVAAAFSPDGTRLAVSDGHRLRVRELPPASGQVEFGRLIDAPKLDGPPPAAVAFSPDGRRVVFLPNNRIDPNWPNRTTQKTHWYAQIWGAGSGESMDFLRHGTAQITAAAWSADGKRIATADGEGTVVLWDGETFKEVKRLKLSGAVTAVAFRGDGKQFAAGVSVRVEFGTIIPRTGTSGRIEVWAAPDDRASDDWQSSFTATLASGERVRALAFAPDGKALAAGTETADGKGGRLRVWDRATPDGE